MKDIKDNKQTGWRIWSGELKVWMIEALVYLVVLLIAALA